MNEDTDIEDSEHMNELLQENSDLEAENTKMKEALRFASTHGLNLDAWPEIRAFLE